ncbi:MAG: hypothetical protein WA746_24340, partial [Isosphaeraceae bacterium]
MADAPHAPDSPLLSREGQEANPHRLAGLFLKERLTFSEGIGLRFWRDVFYFWDGSAYREVPTGELRAQFSQSLACEFDRLYNHEQVRWARERDETPSPAGHWYLHNLSSSEDRNLGCEPSQVVEVIMFKQSKHRQQDPEAGQ